MPPGDPASSIILEERHGVSRNTRRFFSAVRAVLSHLVDSSAFEEISSGREVSVIFTANGPLIYRWESKNQNPSARRVDRSELCIRRQCRLFLRGDSLDSAMETTNGAAKGFFARFLLLFWDYASDCAGSKFSVHIVHFSNPGGSTGALGGHVESNA